MKSIPAKAEGKGSSINGDELLFLSPAPCFCNDICREAARRKMYTTSVEVMVNGEFDKEGEPASKIQYAAIIQSPGSSTDEINDLINHVDTITEIHNTLRRGIAVTFKK